MSNEPREPTGLLAYLIRNKTFSIVIWFSLGIALSVIAWIKIPMEVLPKENVPPVLYLRVDAKDSLSPEKQEVVLTLPVEGVIRTIGGISQVSSSTGERGVSATITFKPKTNLDMAVLELQEGLQSLENQGLLEMRRVSISKFNPDATAIIKMSVTREPGIADPIKLIKDDLQVGLESISEISKVDIQGLEPVLYEFKISQQALAENDIQPSELIRLLNFRSSRESLGSVAFGNSDRTIGVKSKLVTEDLNEVRNQPGKKNSALTIESLAKVREVDKSKDEILRKNGETAVFLEVFSKDGANLFNLDKNLKAYLKQIKEDSSDLSKVNLEFIFNRTDDLKLAIDDVVSSLYQSMLISSLVVLVFFRKLRTTALIASTIPLSLLLTVLILYMKGASLNLLTLSGLILSVGLVVDNAVVVIERIYMLKDEYKSFKDAAAAGAKDMSMALLMSTLSTVIIFLPAAFVEGGDSFTDILKAFQLPMVAALIAAYFVGILFVPVAILFIKEKNISFESGGGKFDKLVNSVFKKIQRRRYAVAVIGLVIVGVVANKIMDIEQTDIETPRDPLTTVNVKFSTETTKEAKREAFEKLERDLLGLREQFGFKFMISEFNPKYTSGAINLYPNQGTSSDEDLKKLDDTIGGFLSKWTGIPGMSTNVGYSGYSSGAVQKKQVVNLEGIRMFKLLEIQEILKPIISQIPGVVAVNNEREESGVRNFTFIPYDNVMGQLGLSLDAVAGAISAAMSQVGINSLKLDGKAIGAKIILAPNNGKWIIDDILNLKIPVDKDRKVSLGDLGKFIKGSTLSGFGRKSGVVSGRLGVVFDDKISQNDYWKAMAQVKSTVAKYDFPEGYGLPSDDRLKKIEEMRAKSNFVIYLAGLLIYLLLASLFESLLIPFAILFTVPLTIVFGVAGLYALGMPLDVMARFSLIILVGIGVNNAIILIDVFTKLRGEGFPRDQAIVTGCTQRFNAVLMSTATSILGVLPVAIGNSKIMGIPYSSLGISIISGMLFSTIVTLVVLPAVYEIFDIIEMKFKNLLF